MFFEVSIDVLIPSDARSSSSALVQCGISVFSESCFVYAHTVSFDDCTSVDECGTFVRFSSWVHPSS